MEFQVYDLGKINHRDIFKIILIFRQNAIIEPLPQQNKRLLMLSEPLDLPSESIETPELIQMKTRMMTKNLLEKIVIEEAIHSFIKQ